MRNTKDQADRTRKQRQTNKHTLTVGKLLKILEGYPKNRALIMSKDGEGNDFSPAAAVGDGLYVAEHTWSGHIYNLDERDLAGKEAEKVIVLWPTN